MSTGSSTGPVISLRNNPISIELDTAEDVNGFQVHGSEFSPPRRGRTPLTNIEPFIRHAMQYGGQWVSKTYTENNANSVVRQIKNKYDSEVVEVCSLAQENGKRTVYIKVNQMFAND